ncbi:hypothetical protein D9M71_306210 [compost metagenome]
MALVFTRHPVGQAIEWPPNTHRVEDENASSLMRTINLSEASPDQFLNDLQIHIVEDTLHVDQIPGRGLQVFSIDKEVMHYSSPDQK